MTKLAFAFLSALLLILAPAMMAQQKIGYVNSSKIFDELPEAREAAKRLENYTKPIQDTLQMLKQQITDKIEEYRKKSALMTEQAKATAQQELQDMQARAQEYASGKDQELARQRDVIFSPVREKILKAIDLIAKREKYSFVLDQNENVNIVLFADPKNDLTNRVLDNLKRGQ